MYFAMVFAPPPSYGLVEAILHTSQIVRVNSASPFGAAGLLGLLGQAVHNRITRRNLIPFRANVVRVGSDQSELTSKGKLQIALGQGPLCLLVVRNVTRNPEQLIGPAAG